MVMAMVVVVLLLATRWLCVLLLLLLRGRRWRELLRCGMERVLVFSPLAVCRRGSRVAAILVCCGGSRS